MTIVILRCLIFGHTWGPEPDPERPAYKCVNCGRYGHRPYPDAEETRIEVVKRE